MTEELTKKEVIASRKKNVHRTDRRSQEELGNWIGRGWIPLVSGRVGQLSGRIPLVSAYVKELASGIPSITLPRYWGIMPSRKWGKTILPKTRRITLVRPTEMSLGAFIVNILAAPVQPVYTIFKLAEKVEEQAREEQGMKRSKSKQEKSRG